MSSLEKLIIENDIEELKNHLDKVSRCTDSKFSISPLEMYKLILIACEHNKLNSLELLLSCVKNVITLHDLLGSDELDSDSENEMKLKIFYSAISSNRCELLNILSDKWIEFLDNTTQLYYLISDTYSKIKLTNVHLSDEMKITIYSKLKKLFPGKVNSVPYLDRINAILDSIELLEYHFKFSKKEIILHILEYVVKNIHILKKQLKCTYDRIPWEEVEFCVVIFLISQSRIEKCNLFYCSTLNPDVILEHLTNFKQVIIDLYTDLTKLDENFLLKLPNGVKRENVVKSVTTQYPKLKTLYRDYSVIRDIYSFERIDIYVTAAISSDPSTEGGRLIILRALQVIGENLKNTLESPKLSERNIQLLTMALPERTRQFILDIRNKLSHFSYKRYDITQDILCDIQNDLKKVSNTLTNMHQVTKLKSLISYLKHLQYLDKDSFLSEIIRVMRCIEKSKNCFETMNLFIAKEQSSLKIVIEEIVHSVSVDESKSRQLINEIKLEVERSLKVFGEHSAQLSNLLLYFKFLATLGQYNPGEPQSDFIGVMHESLRHFFTKNQYLNSYIYQNDHLFYDFQAVKCLEKLDDFVRLWTLIRQLAEIEQKRGNVNTVNKWLWNICSSGCFSIFTADSIAEFWSKAKVKQANLEFRMFLDEESSNEIFNQGNAVGLYDLKVLELKNTLKNNFLTSETHLIKNLLYFKSQTPFKIIVEMLLLEVLSVLESTGKLINNINSLDTEPLILTGKCLRDHLAHDNPLYNVLLSDTQICYILDTIHLCESVHYNNFAKQEMDIVTCKDDAKRCISCKFYNDLETLFLHSSKNEHLNNNFKCDIKFKSSYPNATHNSAQESNITKDSNSKEQCSVSRQATKLHNTNYKVNKSGHYESNAMECYQSDRNFNENGGLTLSSLYESVMNNFEISSSFLLQDIKSKTTDEAGNSALYLSLMLGKEEIVRDILKLKPHIHSQDIHGESPLTLAIVGGNVNIVKLLLSENLHKDNKDLLSLAVFCNQSNILQQLINSSLNDGGKALNLAINMKRRNMVRLLTKKKSCTKNKELELKGKDIKENGRTMKQRQMKEKNNKCVVTENTTKGINGKNEVELGKQEYAWKNDPIILFSSVNTGDVSLLRDLFLQGLDIKMIGNGGESCLHVAAWNGYDEITTFLIGKGAYIDAIDKKGKTPLHIAGGKGHHSVVKVLINAGADVNIYDIKGMKPVEYAILSKQCDTVKHFLSYNNVAISCSVPPKEQTYLHLAAQSGNVDIINLLINEGLYINPSDSDGSKPIHIAAKEGHVNLIKYLLNKNINLYETGLKGSSLLHYSASAGQIEVIKFLKEEYDYDLNFCDDDNESALHWASLCGQKESVIYLLQNGACFDITNNEGKTPQHMSEMQNHSEITNILQTTNELFTSLVQNDLLKLKGSIDAGAIVNSRSIIHGFPLHYASKNGLKAAAELLISCGCKINIKGNNNYTPLLHASENSNYDMVITLLSNGAIYNSISSNNKTAFELAENCNVQNLLNLIDNAFNKINSFDESVINDLKRVKDKTIGKAILNACDMNNKTLLVSAVCHRLVCVEEMKLLFHDYSELLKLRYALDSVKTEEYDDALNVYQQILLKRRSIFGPNSPACLDIEVFIADTLYNKQEFKKAFILYEEIHEKLKNSFGENSRECLKCKSSLASALCQLGNYQESLTMLEEIIEKQRLIYGELDNDEILETLVNKANSLILLDKHEEAFKIYQTIIKKYKSMYGMDDIRTMDAYNNLAMLLGATGKLHKAVSTVQEIIEVEKNLLKQSHSTTLKSERLFAELISKAKTEESLELCNEVLKAQKRVLGETHFDIAFTTSLLGDLLLNRNKFVEAHDCYKKAYDIAIKNVDQDNNHPVVLELSKRITNIHRVLEYLGCESLLAD